MLILALPLLSALGFVYWLYVKYVRQADDNAQINDAFIKLRVCVDKLSSRREKNEVPQELSEAVRRILESFERLERDFVGLDLDRKDAQKERVVQGIYGLLSQAQNLCSSIDRSLSEINYDDGKVAVLLTKLAQRYASLEPRARSARSRRLYEHSRVQYEDARQKIDSGVDTDFRLQYMLLQSADDSSRVVERVIEDEERESRADGGAEPHRQDSNSRHSSENGQDHTYRGDDGPITSSYHEGSGYATSSDSSSSSGDSGGGGDGGGGGSD